MNYRLTYDPATPANTKKLLKSFNEKAAVENEKAAKTTDIVVVNPAEVQLDVEKGGEDDDDDDSVLDGDKGSAGSDKKKAIKLANRNKIMDMIVKEQWEELLKLDELNRELSSGRILNDFQALQPSFPPTFKRTRDKNLTKQKGKWNLRRGSADDSVDSPEDDSTGNIVDVFYHHKRIPSFTDRILYKSMSTFHERIRSTFFTSCEEASSSDHKPVRAGFQITLTKGAKDIYIDRSIATHGTRRISSSTTTAGGQYAKFLRFKVSDLKGYDLEEMDSQMFGGGSDPYIIYRSDPPALLLQDGKVDAQGKGVTGPVINHNLNPVWKDPMYLDCASVDVEGLMRNASLIMQVFDKDQLNEDDLIGVVTFPFRDILRKLFEENQPYVFDTVIRSNSEVMGRVSGQIELDYPGMHCAVLKDVLDACTQMAHAREHLTATAATASTTTTAPSMDIMTLGAAEKASISSAGCGCIVQ